ncbi:MAG: hypothetical protein WKG07_04940 [Hymenobacter sp.]
MRDLLTSHRCRPGRGRSQPPPARLTLDEKLALLRRKIPGTPASPPPMPQGEVRLLTQRQRCHRAELSKLGAELAHWREQADSYQTHHAATCCNRTSWPYPPLPPYDGLLATLRQPGRRTTQAQRAALDAGQIRSWWRPRSQHQAHGR